MWITYTCTKMHEAHQLSIKGKYYHRMNIHQLTFHRQAGTGLILPLIKWTLRNTNPTLLIALLFLKQQSLGWSGTRQIKKAPKQLAGTYCKLCGSLAGSPLQAWLTLINVIHGKLININFRHEDIAFAVAQEGLMPVQCLVRWERCCMMCRYALLICSHTPHFVSRNTR